MESGRLNGKTAIVTGGARGIGFGIASRYADEGARVVIADVLEEEGRKAAMDIGPMAELMVTYYTSFTLVVPAQVIPAHTAGSPHSVS